MRKVSLHCVIRKFVYCTRKGIKIEAVVRELSCADHICSSNFLHTRYRVGYLYTVSLVGRVPKSSGPQVFDHYAILYALYR